MLKIPSIAVRRNYELTVATLENFTQKELNDLIASIEQLVSKYKGKVVSQDNWGKKPLAYTLYYQKKAQSQAVYLHFILEMDAETIAEFKKQLHLQKEIMRFLLVVGEEEQSKTEES